MSQLINAKPKIVLANLYRMHHLGLVVPVAIVNYDDHDPDGRSDLLWAVTAHSREHRLPSPHCYGCRIRERYFAASEALLE